MTSSSSRGTCCCDSVKSVNCTLGTTVTVVEPMPVFMVSPVKCSESTTGIAQNTCENSVFNVQLGDAGASVIFDAKINDKCVYACGDQGSSVSLIGRDLLDALDHDYPRIQLSQPVLLRTATGQVARITEAVRLTFTMGMGDLQHTFEYDLLVASGFGALLLLGID
eukprot:53743-Eustigmatos_ZCMA.PRE.1